MMTLQQLQQAYQQPDHGLEPVEIDNDTTYVYKVSDPDWTDAVKVFEMHPYDLLNEALDLLGIPHQHV